MQGEIVWSDAMPMLFVECRSSMNPDEIAKAMQDAFGRIAPFLAKHEIVPTGPAYAVYSDWDGMNMRIQVGFPVKEEDIGKAEGDVFAGLTPEGRAVKMLHKGPYSKLRETYALLENGLKEDGVSMGDTAWEVYLNDPDKVAEEDLLTEVYLQLDG